MVEPKCAIGFACQRCSQPIKIDTGFNSLGEHTLAELSLPIHTAPVVDLETHVGSFDQYVPPFHLTESGNGANGFTVVGGEGETECLSHHVRVQAALFDIMSGATEIDHPICEECTDTLLDLLDQELKSTEDDLNSYSLYLKKQETNNEEQDLEKLKQELESLKLEEKGLRDELEELEVKHKSIMESIVIQEKERERLDEQESHYLCEFMKHRYDRMVAEDELYSIECQTDYSKQLLSKLKKTNVFNATFLIWHSGHFGTINNFRLGRLPSAPVDWNEINAGWGQTALMLTALARKINFTFKRYRIVPYGNNSYIEDLLERRKLPLYGSGGIRFLWDTKFDAAMVAFLDCLQQFKEEVEKGDLGFCLPYRMEKGRIEDTSGIALSVKTQFNSEEQWTKSLKFLLTNLKWCLAWVSSQFAKEEKKHAQH